ncbi:Mitotic spindle assembly checkpoint protein MAD1 [Microtus ochrogaster]|uniref:Mitotic spindle assembly checkpoint protein MAD1 n=1 Tax=Microtus ochrogaster TaxID=79684 RepID=A0A8J6GWI9_MICOH|nr:Mitotic spindle assembly checkpoint protein MAD1 [Microtus ochrogaster]
MEDLGENTTVLSTLRSLNSFISQRVEGGSGLDMSTSAPGSLQLQYEKNMQLEERAQQIRSKSYLIQVEREKMQMELSHKRARVELERAANTSARNYEREVDRNQELLARIRQFQEREAAAEEKMREQLECHRLCKQNLDATNQQLRELEDDLATARERISSLKGRVSEMQLSAMDQKVQVKRLESEKQELKEQLDLQQRKCQEANQKIQELQVSQEEKADQEQKIKERDGMRAILGSYDSELTQAEYSAQLTQRMWEAEDMVQKVHAHSSEMEAQLSQALEDLGVQKQRADTLEMELKMLRAQTSSTETSFPFCKEEVDALRLKVEELESERSRLEQEKQALEMQMERLTLQPSQCQHSYPAQSSHGQHSYPAQSSHGQHSYPARSSHAQLSHPARASTPILLGPANASTPILLRPAMANTPILLGPANASTPILLGPAMANTSILLSLAMGDYNQSRTKVLHMSLNPTSMARQRQREDHDRLQGECERLRGLVHALERGGPIPADLEAASSLPSSKEVAELRKQVESAELKNQRLKEVFQTKIQEFRKVCYTLTGYQIDVTTESQYRLTSQYAEHQSDCLIFKATGPSGSKMQLLETEFSRSVPELIELHLLQQDSIPAFLSALTIELFSRQTSI